MTKTQIANVALGLLGAEEVSDVDADTTVSAQTARLHWDLVRDELLRAKDWNFATKRAVLEIAWRDVATVSNEGGLYGLTLSGAHGLTNGDFVYVEADDDTPGIEGVWEIESVASNRFKLLESEYESSDTTDPPRFYVNPPRFDFDWAFALPADYLKALDWNGKPGGTSRADWEIVNGYIYSNDAEENAELRYTAQITTVTQWPSSFIQAFAHALAAAMASKLAVDQTLGERMRARAENMALLAAGPNNVETRPRAVLGQQHSSYLRARAGLSTP